ncbi:hypothetical protein [Bacillus sp. FJAT-27916]|uniref:hypothetical protein n=1 Tax=Bacillus sp. FJAT-27916 TaxID=1679169 RepID=UPI000ACD65DB|nr:hypothetical protein [Bacillus sp. FJAT-27916]
MKMDWNEIYRAWRCELENMYPFVSKELNIEEIKVNYKGTGYIDGVTWWPSIKLDERKKALEENFRNIELFDETRKGIRKTANMLWEVRNDPEGIALVWIAASLWNKRERMSLKVDEMLKIALKELADRYEIQCWHNLSKTVLPICLDKELRLFDVKLGEMEMYSLISMAVIESSLMNSNYTIVHLYS